MENELAMQVVEQLGEYLGPLLEKGEAALIKGGEKALESAASKTVQSLWQKLGGAITGRPQAKAAAEKLASSPNDAQAKQQFADELLPILQFMPNLAQELKAILEQASDGSHNTVHADKSAVAIGKDAAAANNNSTVIKGDVHGDITVNN